MSDEQNRTVERGDDEAAALVAYRRTHDTRACPVCGWAGKGLAVVAQHRLASDLGGLTGERVFALAHFRGRPIHSCGRCGVVYAGDAAGLSLECMEFEARRGETT